MGITRVAGLTGLDRIGIPVMMSVRPASRSVAVSLGKGLDAEAAWASAVMEAVETWTAERLTLPLRHASFEELEGGHDFLGVDRLPHRPGRPWRRDSRILWATGLEAFSGRDVLLPYELVHTDYTLPGAPGSGFFVGSTNGLASGNHRLEAAVHALCEVVERHGTARWQRLRREERAARLLDLETVDDSACRSVLACYEAAGLEPLLWDTTSEIGVASYVCVLVDRRAGGTHPGFGAGCHLSRIVALARALLEAAQVRLTYIAGARDDLSRADFGPMAFARKQRLLEAMADDPPTRTFGAAPDVRLETCAADLAHLLARLQAAGFDEAAFLDLTREAVGIPVVRVVVPGLEVEESDLGSSRRRLDREEPRP
jgi:ribosomal protein S12 methylthiotransferase accessory factor